MGNATEYSLGCIWQNDTYTNDDSGWCYEDIGLKTCANITNDRDCMDTFYCFWNNTGSTCQDPGDDVNFQTEFKAWYPGCYIFDQMGSSACANVTGCGWNSGLCMGNSTITNTDSQIGGIRCSYINNSEMCNKMVMLPTCCEWQAGVCQEINLQLNVGTRWKNLL